MTEPLWWAMSVQEACASVSLSHPDECTCDVCLAGSGDHEALVRMLLVVELERARRSREPT